MINKEFSNSRLIVRSNGEEVSFEDCYIRVEEGDDIEPAKVFAIVPIPSVTASNKPSRPKRKYSLASAMAKRFEGRGERARAFGKLRSQGFTKFATGGRVSSSTIALVGEGGHDCIAVPKRFLK